MLLPDSSAIQTELQKIFRTQLITVSCQKHKISITANPHNFSFRADEWFTKKQLIISRISSLLGKNERIFARQCIIKPIHTPEAKAFLNENHMMGYATARYKIALFYHAEIVAVGIFSKGRNMHHLAHDERSFELVRFASKKFVTVTGGLSKLLNYFCQHVNAADVMTYVDKEWAEGKAFQKIGFRITDHTPPIIFLLDTKTGKCYNSSKLPDNIKSSADRNQFISVANSGNIRLVKSFK